MPYNPSARSIPDWEAVILGLQETLEDVLDTLEMETQQGIRADIRALNAYGELNEHIKLVEQDLGL